MLSDQNRILIADDEPDILEIISFRLSREGYEVYTAKDGNEALEKAKKLNPFLIILDVMMPHKTGIEVCSILRTLPAFKNTFIIFLTALDDEVSHVKGLDMGADDYITKPISPKILLSRINALIRRNPVQEEKVLNFNSIKIDAARHLVQVGDETIVLARKEFELLYLLASKPGRVFLRHEILDNVWGQDVIVGDRTIDVHIRKLRQKLGVDCINTIKGVGYKFSDVES
jgi:two-component system alkaline phosphatase synthesis response regulator PhoP